MAKVKNLILNTVQQGTSFQENNGKFEGDQPVYRVLALPHLKKALSQNLHSPQHLSCSCLVLKLHNVFLTRDTFPILKYDLQSERPE
jgi:hypothetical protein